ncbi:MAG: OmpH family outer membrane protein [Mariprofundales bacterium]
MKRIMMAFVLAFLLVGTYGTQAIAKEMKVAFVDLKDSIASTQTYQSGMRTLESFQKKKQQELDDLRDRIGKLENNLQSQSMMMSPDSLAQKQEELSDLRKSFTRKQQDAQEDLQRKNNLLYQGILKDFFDTVRDYGKANGYDMIFHKGAALIYGDEAHDLTTIMAKELDKKRK